MPRIFWLSRSPSPSTLSTWSKLSEEMVQRDYDRKTRRHWKEIFASFILIASFVTVIVFIMGLNLKMSSGRKPYKGSRQRGPFGLPETTTPEKIENGGETADYTRRSTVKGDPKTYGPKGRPGGQPGEEERPRPPYPEVGGEGVRPGPPYTEEEDTEEPEYEGKLRAPHLEQSGKNGAKCSTPLCQSLKQWFKETLGRQADPCKERNTFLCDPAVPFPGFKSPLAKVRSVVISKPDRAHGTAMRQQGASNEGESTDLLKSCLEYSREPDAGVSDILLFLSHLNLDQRRMVDDPAEDPLARMMELSLEYGVDAPVSFARQYDVTGESSAPYVVKIILNPEVNDFFTAFRSLEEDEIGTFYQFCLKTYAQLEDSVVAEQLVNADEELSDFLNTTGAFSRPSRISISKLAEATGVKAGRWKELLGSFSRSSQALNEVVIADEQALTFVAYLSRPVQSLAMRRLLAWHVLRYMVGPKVDIMMAANRTEDEGRPANYNAFHPKHQETKCAAMVARLRGVPYAALSLWEGSDAVSTASIVDVTRFMGDFQDAMASVFRSPPENRSDLSENDNATVSGPPVTSVALFPITAGSEAASVSLFTALDGGNESTGESPAASTRSFPFRWLRHLRAWYALPPLVQALLPRMAAVAHVERPGAFFRPPYYDAGAPPEYNFATLGQVISKAMAHELSERRQNDPTIGKRWRGFWEDVDTADGKSVYCLKAGFAKNDTWREKKLDESKLIDKARLEGVLGSRIAYLAFLRAQRPNATTTGLTEMLPGVDLSSKQLFFVMHCALSCVMGQDPDSVRGPGDQRCMVAYRSRKRSNSRRCRQVTGGGIPNECHYI